MAQKQMNTLAQGLELRRQEEMLMVICLPSFQSALHGQIVRRRSMLDLPQFMLEQVLLRALSLPILQVCFSRMLGLEIGMVLELQWFMLTLTMTVWKSLSLELHSVILMESRRLEDMLGFTIGQDQFSIN